MTNLELAFLHEAVKDTAIDLGNATAQTMDLVASTPEEEILLERLKQHLSEAHVALAAIRNLLVPANP